MFSEKVTKITLPVYGWEVNIIYTNDISQSRTNRVQEIGALKKPVRITCDAMHEYSKLYFESWVFITEKCTIGTVVHEFWHVIEAIFRTLEIKMDNENVAYHLGYLTDKYYEWLNQEYPA